MSLWNPFCKYLSAFVFVFYTKAKAQCYFQLKVKGEENKHKRLYIRIIVHCLLRKKFQASIKMSTFPRLGRPMERKFLTRQHLNGQRTVILICRAPKIKLTIWHE